MTAPLLAEWFWVDRWTGSRGYQLPLHARGLYREMLSQAWRRGAQLPANPEAIRRICGITSTEWRRAWPLVRRFWIRRRDILVNDTQCKVFLLAKLRAEAASRRGTTAAIAKNTHKRRSSAAVKAHMDHPLSLSLSTTPIVPFKGDDPRRLRRPRKGALPGGPSCPHQPRCRSFKACIERTLDDGRHDKGRP